MRKQQQVWHDEHTTHSSLPAIAKADPSGGLVKMLDMLEKVSELSGRAIDIGCGMGRNSIYLATRGYDTYGVDYIEPAIDGAQKLAESRGLSAKLTFVRAEIDKPWQFKDNYFDVAVDSFSSIDIETLSGRKTCRDEMFRTLKPGGHAMVTVVSADDEWEQELIKTSPGGEPNSTIWPQNGKFQKDYDEAELREFYKDFKVIALEKISRPGMVKLDREYTATNYWLVLQKP